MSEKATALLKVEGQTYEYYPVAECEGADRLPYSLTVLLENVLRNARDADEAVRWLTELNLLDDAKTARQIVERGVRRGYGERRIRQMLYEKKVPREHWDEALSVLPPPEEPIDDYLRANPFDAADPKQRKRAQDALLRRGFEWNDIKSGLRRFGGGADALEEE